MRIAITFFLSLVFSSLLQASPIPFSPIVRSYSVSDYNVGIQNWAIAQDERGVMYFGNNSGLLEFDGSAWRLYELPTKGIYNPQIQISAESETKRSIFREKDKTKRSKKESAQHSKSRNKSFVMTSVSAL